MTDEELQKQAEYICALFVEVEDWKEQEVAVLNRLRSVRDQAVAEAEKVSQERQKGAYARGVHDKRERCANREGKK